VEWEKCNTRFHVLVLNENNMMEESLTDNRICIKNSVEPDILYQAPVPVILR